MERQPHRADGPDMKPGVPSHVYFHSALTAAFPPLQLYERRRVAGEMMARSQSSRSHARRRLMALVAIDASAIVPIAADASFAWIGTAADCRAARAAPSADLAGGRAARRGVSSMEKCGIPVQGPSPSSSYTHAETASTNESRSTIDIGVVEPKRESLDLDIGDGLT